MPLFIAGAMVLGTGVGALASSSASKKAANASQYATDQSTAASNHALDVQQGNTAVARATGDQALGALGSRFGLTPPVGGAVAPGAVSTGAPAQSGGGFNPSTYLAANQDLVDYYNANAGNHDFVKRFPTPEAFATEQYQTRGQQEIANGQRAPLPGSTPQTVATAAPAAPAIQAPNPAITETAPTVDGDGIYTQNRPGIGPAPSYVAPAYRETAVAPLDVGLDKYEKSPDYEFQLSEGNRNILATASQTGGLESGAALKALQTFGQNLAMGDYGQWRDYTTGQFNNDRSFTANRDDAANAFSGAQAQNVFNAANGSYQYGNTLAQGNYNNDRDYASGRYDTRTNNLLSLAGIGQGASAQSNSAVGANANALSNGYLSNANTQGNAALAGAGQTNAAIGNGVNALAYYYGNKQTSPSDPSMKGLY